MPYAKGSPRRSSAVWLLFVSSASLTSGQDWAAYDVPADTGSAGQWVLDWDVSDEFNYDTSTPAGQSVFDGKWRDSKPDGWLGPGATYFSQDNYYVDGGALTIFGSRVPESEQRPNFLEPSFTRNTYTSYITSRETLRPGVYTEVQMTGGGTPLSSNFWLLDDKNETEIDVVEVYGDGSWFPFHPATNVHFFKRGGNGNENDQDHHPRGGINFSRTTHRYGVHWISETEVDFYYDGVRVRQLDLTQDIVDPTGQFLNEPLRLILDLEAHSWRGEGGIPTDAQLADDAINNMRVDWIRTYQFVEFRQGDANGDGAVDLLDLEILGQNYGASGVGWGEADFNDDGQVNLLDLNILGHHFDSPAAPAIPEPTTVGLLITALVAVRRRRLPPTRRSAGGIGR